MLQDFDFESFPFHIFSNKPKTLNPLVLADDVDDPFLSFSCSLNLICVNMPTYVCRKYCVVISQGQYYYVFLFHEKKNYILNFLWNWNLTKSSSTLWLIPGDVSMYLTPYFIARDFPSKKEKNFFLYSYKIYGMSIIVLYWNFCFMWYWIQYTRIFGSLRQFHGFRPR